MQAPFLLTQSRKLHNGSMWKIKIKNKKIKMKVIPPYKIIVVVRTYILNFFTNWPPWALPKFGQICKPRKRLRYENGYVLATYHIRAPCCYSYQNEMKPKLILFAKVWAQVWTLWPQSTIFLNAMEIIHFLKSMLTKTLDFIVILSSKCIWGTFVPSFSISFHLFS